MIPTKLITPPPKPEYKHKKGQKDIIVGLFSDPIGTMGMSVEEEYDLTESDFKEELANFNLTFIRNITPYELKNRSIDIYVFDFGGLMPGCDGLIISQYRGLIEQIEEHPNMLVVLWGGLADVYYEDVLHEMFGEDRNFPNVIVKTKLWDKTFDKIREWME